MAAHLLGDTTPHTNDPCDLCGSLKRELLATLDRDGNPLNTGICRQCGMVAHWQRPTEAELHEYYANEYRRSYHREESPSPRRVRRAWINGQRIYRRLKPFIGPKDAVFEIGAGIGCNVKAFELNGHPATGVDPGKGFQRFSCEQLRADVQNQNLFDLKANQQYDLILLIHVIEHFRSPRRALEHIHKLLPVNGLLYVECPNIGAPFATRARLFHFAHVTNFTHSSLKMLAESCGFRVVECFSAEGNPNLQVLLEKSRTLRQNIDAENYERTLEAISRFNILTYHLRPNYLLNRIATLASYLTEFLIGPAWLKGLVQRCQSAKPLDSESIQRRAA